MNDSNLEHARRRHPRRLARASAFALGAVCLACGSDDEADTPALGAAFGGASANPGAGGASSAPSNAPGGSGSASPSSEQPALGNGSPIVASGGSATTGGSGGASMVAAGGSSMVASGGAAGAGGQLGMPTLEACADGAFFCEDFDGIALGALPAVNGMAPERTVNVVADPARGQVLQVLAGASYANKAGFFLNEFVRPDNGSHFGRMFVNVGTFPALDSDHWVLVELTGAVGDQVRPVGGQFERWAPGADGPSAGDWTDWAESDAAAVPGVWQCVEWQMDGANGGNDILLWVDGVQVQPLDRPNFAFPTFNRLWIGWVVYLPGEPSQYDVRFDDIALSTQRIGCD